MNYWKVILATVVIFAAGVMTGGLLVNCVQHTRPKNSKRPETAFFATNSIPKTNSPNLSRAAEFPKLRLPEMWGKEFVGRLNDTLQLAPEQRDKIEKIIADGQEQDRVIWTNNAAQMRKVLQDARQQIREQLTPDQRKQFEDLMKHPPRRPSGATNAPANFPPPAATNTPGV